MKFLKHEFDRFKNHSFNFTVIKNVSFESFLRKKQKKLIMLVSKIHIFKDPA